MNKMMSMFLKGLTAVLMVFGLSGHAAANNCLSDNATFTGSIGSQTTCGDYAMGGCVIGAGGSTCTYTGTTCDFQVVANPKVGRSSDKTTTFSVVNPGFGSPTCQIKMAFTQGNQGANYCQNVYPSGVSGDTLTTLGSKGTAVSHKQLEVCSDEVVVILSPPVVRLSKTVVRVIDGGFDCSEAADSLEVIAPTEVAYCYEISNEGQSDIDGLVLVDDNGTPDNFSDDTEINDIGTLSGGASVMRDSGAMMVTDAGEVVNTATVSGLFDGADCDTCSDSDTARLNVAVACDTDTQDIANDTGQVTTARDADGTTRCSPTQDNNQGDATRSTSMLCDDSCELRPGCKGLNTASCLQPCMPSGNWTYLENGHAGDSCMAGEPSPGNLPLCQEVLGNPNNNPNCGVIHNPSLLRSDGHSSAFSSNPLLYYFPSSGGGDSTGTIYCILLAGENASVCPSGAFVY